MGFTLRAALAALDGTATVTVAELVPAIIQWARGPLAELAAECLDAPRVRMVQADVADVIGAARGLYDARWLAVDNGPAGPVRHATDPLQSRPGNPAANPAPPRRGPCER